MTTEAKAKLICTLIALVAALVAIAGMLMLGANVIMQLFNQGNPSYGQAVAGFIMMVAGSFTAQIMNPKESKNS